MECACNNHGRCAWGGDGGPLEMARVLNPKGRVCGAPSKFTTLQPCVGRPSHLRVAYNRGPRSISTKPDRDTARTIFSGIQPTGIPHVGLFSPGVMRCVPY